jgi:hypothetical protein
VPIATHRVAPKIAATSPIAMERPVPSKSPTVTAMAACSTAHA